MLEKWKLCLDKQGSTGVLITDLSKAFDCLDHDLIIAKLYAYGFDYKAVKLIYDYLSCRFQRVRINSSYSSWKEILKGVPQGSILGPLLFSIYINDMNKAFSHSTVYHFADDTNLLYSNKNPKIIKKKMNQDLKFLFDWLCANRLSLNVAKTEFIIFHPPKMSLNDRIVLTLNRTKIFESRKLKYLGLIIDDRLSWKFHIM